MNKEATTISVLWSGKTDKYFISEELLPSNRNQMVEQNKEKNKLIL